MPAIRQIRISFPAPTPRRHPRPHRSSPTTYADQSPHAPRRLIDSAASQRKGHSSCEALGPPQLGLEVGSAIRAADGGGPGRVTLSGPGRVARADAVPGARIGMWDPAPSILGIQDPLLGEVVASAGDVRHVPTRDQQRIGAKADPAVAADVLSPSGSSGRRARTPCADQQVTFLAPLRTHPSRPRANGAYLPEEHG